MTTNTILKLMVVIVLIVIVGTTMGCVEQNDQYNYTEDEYRPTPQQYYTPEPVDKATPEPIVVSTSKTVSSIPDNYYNITVDQSFIDHGLFRYLDKYTWGRPVGIGEWSFREASELEHELTEKGCNVTIRWADVKTSIDLSEYETSWTKTDDYEQSHCQPKMDQATCWLMIELDGEMVAYDPTYCYWVFEPDNDNQEGYFDRRDRYHSRWYYTENTASTWADWYSATSYNFIDFNDIYEIEDYYMSGEMQARHNGSDMNGAWWSYSESDEYNATDDFRISFGWWMTDEEFHEIESRINRATDWYVCGD